MSISYGTGANSRVRTAYTSGITFFWDSCCSIFCFVHSVLCSLVYLFVLVHLVFTCPIIYGLWIPIEYLNAFLRCSHFMKWKTILYIESIILIRCPLLMKNNLWPIYDTDLLLVTITDILFTSILVFYTSWRDNCNHKCT